MNFKKYNSIENSYRKKFLDKIVEEGHSDETFVVQEKIHGANFSFWVTDDEIKCAKRSGFIKETEKFFNYEKILGHYKDDVRKLFNHIKNSVPELEEMVIYGELYGGIYPHKDVPKSNDSAVQKGVYYSPIQDFIAFDLKINGQYQPVTEANKLFEFAGIPYIKTLFTGTLQECLEYKNDFITTLPAETGLPLIEDNICEGTVIRPIKPIFMWSRERLILKNKNDKFREDGNTRKPKKVKEPKIFSAEVQTELVKIEGYINENRLRNVISKIGQINKEDFGKLMSEFTKDVIEDYTKDEKESFEALEKSDKKIVTKKVGQQAAVLIRNNFLNIVDGEF